MKPIVKIPSILLVPIILILYNCSRKVSEQAVNKIVPPFENMNVEYSENVIDPVSGGEIKLSNGTKITVPKDAFVNAEGVTVTSKVKIKYREFHNSAQILMSGIPMKYGNEDFQTAGMFEIKGSTDNNDMLKLAENKSMKVQMASYASGDEYSFYYFDEKQGQWILKGAGAAEDNKEKKEELAQLPEVMDVPLKPVKQSDSSLVFDLDVNARLYPELKDFNGVVWQYAGTDPELNPEKTPWVFTEKWGFVELKRVDENGITYSLLLRNSKREYTTIVSPVLNGKYYKQALAKFQKRMDSYAAALAVRKAEEIRLQQEADLIRTFSINDFGVYNWDRFYKSDSQVRLAADFKLDKEIPGLDMEKVTVFLVTGNERSVIKYEYFSRSNFSFNPSDENKIVAVLPGNRIAVFGNDEFNSIVGVANPDGNPRYTFILKIVDEQLTADNLDGILASI